MCFYFWAYIIFNNFIDFVYFRTDADGILMRVRCTVKDLQGKPVENMQMVVREPDSKSFYNVQYSNREDPHGHAVLKTDANDQV